MTNARTYSPDRIDPTRTSGLRRAMLADLRRRFKRIRREVWQLIVEEDALGLSEVRNAWSEAARAAALEARRVKGVGHLHEVSEGHASRSYDDIRQEVGTHFEGMTPAEAKARAREFGIHQTVKSRKHAAELVTARIHDRKASAERVGEIGAKPQPKDSGTSLPFDLKAKTPEESARDSAEWLKRFHGETNGLAVHCGGAGGTYGPCPSPHPEAEANKRAGVFAAIKRFPKAAYHAIKAKVAQKYGQLEARYGPNHAKAIVGSALLGVPLPIPGSSFITAAPALAVAEMHRYISRRGVSNWRGMVNYMSGEEIKSAASQLLKELEDELKVMHVGNASFFETCERDERGHCQGTAGVDRPPEGKPSLEEFQHWSDKGWSWGESGWEPPAERAAPIGTISSEEHQAAAASLSSSAKENISRAHGWEKSKPWNATQEDVATGKVHGFVMGKVHSKTEAAHYEGGGVISLSPKFFEIKDEGSRRHVIYHELGHEIADTMSRDLTSFRLADAGVIPREHWMGSANTPEEFVADAYATAHTDPKWLQEKHGSSIKPILDRAAALGMPVPKGLVGNTRNAIGPRWKFMATADQLKAFQDWLKRLFASELLGRSEDELWKRYALEGFRKGAGRSWTDVRQSQLRKERPELFLPGEQDKLRDFYEGSKEEFLRSSFARPVGVEKIKLLAARTFTDLKGVTESMAAKMSKTLLDGLVEGKHSVRIGRDLADDLDIGRPRAERIARTEISRAYSEGQLDALEQMGVKELGVKVEWATAGDAHVCPKCEPLEGLVLKIEDARNMLPLHPNCRCAWIPYLEDVLGNLRTLSGLTVNAIRVSSERLWEIIANVKDHDHGDGSCEASAAGSVWRGEGAGSRTGLASGLRTRRTPQSRSSS